MQEEKTGNQPKQLAIIWGPELLNYDFGPQHPFGALRGELTFSLMQETGLLYQPQVEVLPAVSATREDLLLFHTSEMIDFVYNACLRGYGYLDGGDTPAFEGGMEAGQIVVGSSWRVTEQVASGKARYGMSIVGGLHHAHPGRSSGFCVFNDLAINVKKLRRDFGYQRIAYIDIDAHHGDGVVYGFYDDPDLLAVDFHEDGRYLFPGTGDLHETGRGEASGTKFNLPMPPYSSDQSLIYAFDELVPTLLKNFKPDFILLVCGVDAHSGDPLSEMNYSSASYGHVTRILRKLADELCQGRMVVYGAGGYDIETCALRWTEVAAILADFELPEFIPQVWRESFSSKVGKQPGLSFYEDFTCDNTSLRVENMVKWFKSKSILLQNS